MTYPELQIQFDLNPDNRINVLKNADTCRWTADGYLFVDQEDGQCYLFDDDDGQEDDISKVKIIRNYAFENCRSLTNIKIPSSVKNIGMWTFTYCTSLTSIIIPNSVKSIEVFAFYNCSSLASLKIPDSVESIGYFAFFGCISLKEVVFKGKTIDQVKAMYSYPWGIKDESIIKVES